MVSRLSEKSFSPRKCQFARKIFYENQRCFQKPLTSNNERRSQNAIPRDKIFYENGHRYLIRKKYRNIEIFRKEESATAFQLVALAVLFKKKIRVFVFGYSNVVWVKGEKHHVGAALT